MQLQTLVWCPPGFISQTTILIMPFIPRGSGVSGAPRSFTDLWDEEYPILCALASKPQKQKGGQRRGKHLSSKHLSSQQPCHANIIIPILQMRRLRHRVIKAVPKVIS
jgi:hypothetical protein